MPPANWLLESPETDPALYPLILERCSSCTNLQLAFCLSAEVLYSHYYYITPDSISLTRHYRWLIDFMFHGGYLAADSDVLEIGSNRGAFLKELSPHVGSTLGVDPAENVVGVARRSGVETLCDYFDLSVAKRIAARSKPPSVFFARHCMAHNEFPQRMLEGVSHLLPDDGILVIENNYAAHMVRDSEFDQVYHEHMFYYSVTSLSELLRRSGLRIIDVVLTDLHGGSIVVFAVTADSRRSTAQTVPRLIDEERGTLSPSRIADFSSQASVIRDGLQSTIRKLSEAGNSLAAYGATAKGATLLNFCSLTARDITACADSTYIKQGRFIPGAGIPIIAEGTLFEAPPDYLLLTAWNYKDELIAKVRSAGARDVKFIIPIPSVEIVE